MACLDLSTQICLGLRLAHRALFDCSLPLAAMFAGLPPSSSEMSERKSVVPPSSPAHSSPLGLVLAALAQFV
jgi:hypothetical protein